MNTSTNLSTKSIKSELFSFIERDIEKSKKQPLLVFVLIGLCIFLIPVSLGLLFRDSFDGVLDIKTLIPNLLASTSLIPIPFLYHQRHRKNLKAYKYIFLILIFSLIFTFHRFLHSPIERTIYASSDLFWFETLKCFSKGGYTTLLIGFLLIYPLYFLSSLPTFRWRFMTSLLTGVSGVIMLAFHCDSSSWNHILFGHIGTGIVFGICIYVIMNLVLVLKIKKSLPNLTNRINGLFKIG